MDGIANAPVGGLGALIVWLIIAAVFMLIFNLTLRKSLLFAIVSIIPLLIALFAIWMALQSFGLINGTWSLLLTLIVFGIAGWTIGKDGSWPVGIVVMILAVLGVFGVASLLGLDFVEFQPTGPFGDFLESIGGAIDQGGQRFSDSFQQ